MLVRLGLVGLMLSSLACGSGLDNHISDTGKGGDAGTDSGGGPPVPPPRCLIDLIATCPLAGACQYSGMVGGDQRLCLAGGESVTVVSVNATGGLGGGTNTEVRRSDGTLCYSIEMRCGTFCESNSYTWKDAAGAVVARGLYGGLRADNTESTTVTCEVTGETCNGHNAAADARECITSAVTEPTAGLGCMQGSCP